jgi:hypothetical protein
MTLVVGLVHGDRVYMGADSAEPLGSDLSMRQDPQVFCRRPFLIGFPGFFRMGNLLRYALVLPKYEPETDLQEFMVNEFVARVRKCFGDGGFLHRDKDTGQELGGPFLVGYRGHLFTIQSDLRVVEALDGYDAVGIGDEAALGALYATQGEDPQPRVCSALHAAEHLTGAVRPPFHVSRLESDDQGSKCGDCPDICTSCES